MIKIPANYSSIEPVRDICEEWINLWGGDEWGESMYGLHGASQTSYGLTDEDCAKVAEIMLENVIHQHKWMVEEGEPHYGLSPREEEERVEAKCRQLREYWREGGNLRGFGDNAEKSTKMVDQLPPWMFGEQDLTPAS
jgi:hypothetical protein